MKRLQNRLVLALLLTILVGTASCVQDQGHLPTPMPDATIEPTGKREAQQDEGNQASQVSTDTAEPLLASPVPDKTIEPTAPGGAQQGEGTQMSQVFTDTVEEISETAVLDQDLLELRAQSFTQQFGEASVDFLIEQAIENPYMVGRRFAIGALGTFEPMVAADALTTVAMQSTLIYSQLAIFALSDVEAPDITERLEKFATEPGPEATRIAATLTLRWRGDEATIAELREAAEKSESSRIQPYLDRAAEVIWYRLNALPPDIDGQQWMDCERRFWLAYIEPNPKRGINMVLRDSALKILQGGRLPLVFLEQFDSREPEHAQAVAIYLLGFQKEASAVPGLLDFAKRGVLLVEAATEALILIGNDKAVEALGELLTSEDYFWTSMAVEGLVTIGTEQAAVTLELLAEEEGRADIADYFRQRARYIREHIEP